MKYIKFINPLLFAMLALATSSCDRDEVFEREQYKTRVAVLSDAGFNIFAEELDMTNENEGFAIGNIAASVGGSLATDKPIVIEFEEDDNLVADYNFSNFENDADRYTFKLEKDRYKIEDMSLTIPAGERSGTMKIQVNLAGLSPDSTYFIPLRAKSISAYELNKDKGTVLYRVYQKNYYATTKGGSTTYDHRGIKGTANTMVQKPVFPVAANEVRVFAGIKTFESKEKLINQWSMRLIVDDSAEGAEKPVTILPWNTSSGGLKVRQLEGTDQYPNVFKIVDTGYKTFKTFLIHYEYEDPDDGKTYEMKEELRLEFNEREENDK